MFTSLRPWAAGLLPTWGVVLVRGLPIVGAHLGCLAFFWIEPSRLDWLLFLALTYTRGLAITVGFHRYFSHRSFKTSRAFQFLLAALGCTLFQMGPLWWAAHHRKHHRHSDQDEDLHSPRHGFLWSHFLWAYTPRMTEPDWGTVRDFTRYPEMRALEKFCHLPGLLLAGACYLAGGWPAVVVGFCFSTVLVYFLTNSVNSFGHLFGPRNFDTRDDSRNNLLLGYMALGDGWHNNHHHYPKSAHHGFYWWEWDTSYRAIRLLRRLGLVWDVRTVPDCVLHPTRRAAEKEAPAERLAEEKAAVGAP